MAITRFRRLFTGRRRFLVAVGVVVVVLHFAVLAAVGRDRPRLSLAGHFSDAGGRHLGRRRRGFGADRRLVQDEQVGVGAALQFDDKGVEQFDQLVCLVGVDRQFLEAAVFDELREGFHSFLMTRANQNPDHCQLFCRFPTSLSRPSLKYSPSLSIKLENEFMSPLQNFYHQLSADFKRKKNIPNYFRWSF